MSTTLQLITLSIPLGIGFAIGVLSVAVSFLVFNQLLDLLFNHLKRKKGGRHG